MATDEKGRGRLDTTAATFACVLLHRSGVLVAVEAGVRGRGIEPQLSREAFQIIEGKGTDIFTGLVGE